MSDTSLIDTAEETTPAPRVNPILEELTGDTPIVRWIIPGFLPQGALFAIAGSPGSGKSYLFYTIGLALATGVPVIGMNPTRPHRVLYFDQENSNPDRIQYERWAWKGLGKPSLSLITQNFWCAPFILGSNDWMAQAQREIEEHRPEIFIIDTTTPACHIEDENDNAEATKVISHIRKLQNLVSPAATAIVLKHAKIRPEDGGYTLRGAKAWEGAVDGIVYITKGGGRPRNDGLSTVQILPSKTRAFGLKSKVTVTPTWLDNRDGIVLEGQVFD